MADASGLGNDAGYKGPVKADGWLGEGLKFGGGDHFVYTGATDISGNWTASMWVNNENSGQSTEIVMNSPDSSLRIKQVGTGKVGFTKYGVADYSFNYVLPADGKWKYLTFVGDVGGTTLYVNGSFIETHSAKINLPVQSIGKTTSAFKGTIDEWKIFDRSLDATAIRELYLNDIAAKPSVALQKPATADGSVAGREPELANDADPVSYWEGELGTDASRTWQVDLQGLYAIDGVKVLNVADGVNYVNYAVEASADGANWLPIGVKNDTVPATALGEFYAAGSVKARYVRVVSTYASGGGNPKLADVAVYGSPASVALGKPASAEAAEPLHGPELANDAIPGNATYWDASLNGVVGRWWQVDLGQVYRLDTLIVRNYVDGTRYYQYDVQGSADGSSWTTIATKGDANAATDAGDRYTVNADARYLRVTVTYNSANNSVHLTDFQAFGYALP